MSKSVKTKKRKFQRGFTLIETAFVIIVLSLILTPLFIFLERQQKQDMRLKEEAVNERVTAALALYLKSQGRYPCPADPALIPGDPNFGAEDCAGSAGRSASAGFLVGAVPTRELNLPFKTAANAQGWKYFYGVTQTYADIPPNFGTPPVVRIFDEAGVQMGGNQNFIIVNPGPDGKGSINLLSGTPSPTVCGGAVAPGNMGAPLDQENCDNDLDFREANFSAGPLPTAALYYDDTVMYSLAREESTFWMVNRGPGGLNIQNRNAGNVGIGTNTPEARLHVQGGVVVDNGDVRVLENIQADQTIRAGNDVRAGQAVKAPNFFYCSPGAC